MKPRHHIYLDETLTTRLDRMAERPGVSKSAIITDALRSYLDRKSAQEIDPIIKARLDKLALDFRRLERNQKFILETLGLFVRYQLTIIPPLPKADQEAAHAMGEARFQSFIETVARRFASGKGMTGDLLDRACPEENPGAKP